MDISTALSIVLKENRNRLHLSQEQLAFKSGKVDIKTSDFIKQIENLL